MIFEFFLLTKHQGIKCNLLRLNAKSVLLFSRRTKVHAQQMHRHTRTQMFSGNCSVRNVVGIARSVSGSLLLTVNGAFFNVRRKEIMKYCRSATTIALKFFRWITLNLCSLLKQVAVVRNITKHKRFVFQMHACLLLLRNSFSTHPYSS